MAKKRYIYEYPRPMVTVDVVVFTAVERRLSVLLIKRRHEPYLDHWALPGGFIEMDETLEASAARELREETGMAGMELNPIGVFGDPGRDPRGRCISVAYMAVVDWHDQVPVAGDDALETAWFSVVELPKLAFDHYKIIQKAVQELREEPRYGGFLVGREQQQKQLN